MKNDNVFVNKFIGYTVGKLKMPIIEDVNQGGVSGCCFLRIPAMYICIAVNIL